jgi:AraC family transcriptional regulator, transcriptional activator of pobA
MTTSIKKYQFKPGLPIEFELLQLQELYKHNKIELTSAHRTGFYHIFWFRKGNLTHVVDFKPVKIRPNSLLFLNKDTVQRFDSKATIDGACILFTDSFFCKSDEDTKFLRSSILFNNLFAVSQIQLSQQSTLFSSILDLMKAELQHAKDQSQPDILKNLLHNFFLLAERELRKQGFTEVKKGPDLDYVLLFKDLLETSYKTQKQVSSYAEQLRVTEKRLNQATSKVLGKSPKEMIDDRVLLEAKRLLVHTNESAKEIGFALGFEEPTNFIKYFRKHINVTPVEFREQFSKA